MGLCKIRGYFCKNCCGSILVQWESDGRRGEGFRSGRVYFTYSTVKSVKLVWSTECSTSLETREVLPIPNSWVTILDISPVKIFTVFTLLTWHGDVRPVSSHYRHHRELCACFLVFILHIRAQPSQARVKKSTVKTRSGVQSSDVRLSLYTLKGFPDGVPLTFQTLLKILTLILFQYFVFKYFQVLFFPLTLFKFI